MMTKSKPLPEECPFWARGVTLGRAHEGTITFVQNKGEKKEMLQTALADTEHGAIFFIAWTGQWTTDIFAVSEKNITDWIASGGKNPSFKR